MYPDYDNPGREKHLKDQAMPGDPLVQRWPGSEHGQNPSSVLSDDRNITVGEYNAFVDQSRPLSISLIAWFYILGMVLAPVLILIFNSKIPYFPGWLWLPALLDYALTGIMIGGLWAMRRYGAQLFILQVIFSAALDLLFNNSGLAFSTSILTLIMTAFIFQAYYLMTA